MALDVEDIVLHPFEELIQRGKEMLANAEVAESERYLSAQPMLRSARAIIREGERALQKVRPLLTSQLEKHGDVFKDAMLENNVIFESRRQLEDLLYDIDDFIELHNFSADRCSEVQAASKTYALSAIENIRRYRFEDAKPLTPTSPPASLSSTPPSAHAALFPPLPPLPPMRSDSITTLPTRTDSINNQAWNGVQPIKPLAPLRRTASNSNQRSQGDTTLVQRTSMLGAWSHATSTNGSHSRSSSFQSRHSSKPSFSGSLPPARPGHQWVTIPANNGTGRIGSQGLFSPDVVAAELERSPRRIEALPPSGSVSTAPWTTAWVTAQHDSIPEHAPISDVKNSSIESSHTKTDSLENSRLHWFMFDSSSDSSSMYEAPSPVSTGNEIPTASDSTNESKHITSVPALSIRKRRTNFQVGRIFDSSQIPEFGISRSAPDDHEANPEYETGLILADEVMDVENDQQIPRTITSPRSESALRANATMQEGQAFRPERPPRSESAFGFRTEIPEGLSFRPGRPPRSKTAFQPERPPRSDSALGSQTAIQEGLAYRPPIPRRSPERPLRSESALGSYTSTKDDMAFQPLRSPRSQAAFQLGGSPRVESALGLHATIQERETYQPWIPPRQEIKLRSHSAIQEGREFQWRPPRPAMPPGPETVLELETAIQPETLPKIVTTLPIKTPHKRTPSSRPTPPKWYSREENCSIGPESTLIQMHGFCEGAHVFKASGLQEATKTIVLLESAITTYQDTWGAAALALGSNEHVAVGTKKVISQCNDCEYRHSSIEIKSDFNKDPQSNIHMEGVCFRLRFLYKSHLSADSSLSTKYGCAFCSHLGHTVHEGDATVFTSQGQLLRHLARHPQPLPIVPGFTVVYGDIAADDPAANNYDLHFPNPPVDCLSFMSVSDAAMLSCLPAAKALKSNMPKEGEKPLTDPDGHRNVLMFLAGARIVGVEFPEKWGGKWCMGWHDGLRGAFPAKLITVEPPAKSDIRLPGTNNDGVVVTSRWKWETKDTAAGWLTFDKNTIISNVSWLNQDSWCWSGTTKDGKVGFFPSSHIKPHSIRDPGSKEATRLTKTSRGVSLFSRRQSFSYSTLH